MTLGPTAVLLLQLEPADELLAPFRAQMRFPILQRLSGAADQVIGAYRLDDVFVCLTMESVFIPTMGWTAPTCSKSGRGDGRSIMLQDVKTEFFRLLRCENMHKHFSVDGSPPRAGRRI